MQSECSDPSCPSNKKKKVRPNMSKTICDLTDVLKVLLERVEVLTCVPERLECVLNELAEIKEGKSYKLLICEEGANPSIHVASSGDNNDSSDLGKNSSDKGPEGLDIVMV